MIKGKMARAKGKIDRRQLKEPDEFITLSVRTIEYVRANWKWVSTAAACVLVVIVLVFAYRFYRAGVEAAASGMISEAIAGFEQNPTDSKPFERVLRVYGGTKGARLARLYLGHTLYRKGELDKASGAYGVLAADSSAQESVRTGAILGQGYSLVDLKKCQEAQIAFGRLSSKADIPKQQALLAIGQCYELKGDKAAAIEKYREFAGKYPQSSFLTPALRARIQESPKK